MSIAVMVAGQFDVVTTTVARYILGSNNSNWVNNVRVSHVEFSAADPTAVVALTIGRGHVTGAPSGSDPGSQLAYFGSGQPLLDVSSRFFPFSFGLVPVGAYYIQGGRVLKLDFPQPIGCILNWDTSTDSYAFGYSIQRVDGGTADVDYRLSVWFDEY